MIWGGKKENREEGKTKKFRYSLKSSYDYKTLSDNQSAGGAWKSVRLARAKTQQVHGKFHGPWYFLFPLLTYAQAFNNRAFVPPVT